jgi:hypothetical protein
MVTVLLWAVLCLPVLLVVLTVALLFLPVRFRIWLSAPPHARLRIHVAPFAGVMPQFELVDSQNAEKDTPAGDGPDQSPSKQDRRGVRWQSRVVLSATTRFVADLIRACRVEEVHADLDFGFDDPADTGQVFGLLAPWAYGLNGVAPDALHIRPDFQNTRFDLGFKPN